MLTPSHSWPEHAWLFDCHILTLERWFQMLTSTFRHTEVLMWSDFDRFSCGNEDTLIIRRYKIAERLILQIYFWDIDIKYSNLRIHICSQHSRNSMQWFASCLDSPLHGACRLSPSQTDFPITASKEHTSCIPGLLAPWITVEQSTRRHQSINHSATFLCVMKCFPSGGRWV